MEQKAALVAKARDDGFVSIKDGVRFVQEQFQIEYTASGMTKVFSALSLRKKVPRPRNAKATEEAQEGYKKKGLTQSLADLQVAVDALICFGDEMRLGMHSQLRRRWCPRGHKLVQPQQMKFEWQWLSLAVDVQTGRLLWRWQERLRADCVQETVAAWKEQGVGALVWDNAPSHHAKVVTETGLPLAYLLPFSPELNPAERVFEEVRRGTEGKIYDTLADKRQAVEDYLNKLAKDAQAVKRIPGWQWIQDSIRSLAKAQQEQGLDQR